MAAAKNQSPQKPKSDLLKLKVGFVLITKQLLPLPV